MCWSASASVAMVALGGVAAGVAYARGEPRAIWLTIGYFTLMEGLQASGYAVVDQCSDPANRAITWASYLHIAAQPIMINAFAMALAPVALSPSKQRLVYGLSALTSLVLLIQAMPIPAFGPCDPASPLCGVVTCLIPGDWHIGWRLPLNGLFNTWPDTSSPTAPRRSGRWTRSMSGPRRRRPSKHWHSMPQRGPKAPTPSTCCSISPGDGNGTSRSHRSPWPRSAPDHAFRRDTG